MTLVQKFKMNETVGESNAELEVKSCKLKEEAVVVAGHPP